MQFSHFKVKSVFITDVLATTPASEDLFDQWRQIRLKRASAAVKRAVENGDLPEDEEQAHVQSLAEVSETIDKDDLSRFMVFPRHPVSGFPCLWNYQIRGSLKERATDMATEIGPAGKSGDATELKQPASKIEKIVYVGPRMVPLTRSDGSQPKIERTERPLRGMTQLGPRVTLVASESVRAGCQIEYDVYFWEDNKFGVSEEALHDIIDATGLGFGGWRTGNFGMADVDIKKVAVGVSMRTVIGAVGSLSASMLVDVASPQPRPRMVMA